MTNENFLKITIMGREFSISCHEEEREQILQAAEFLDEKIQEVKKEGKIIDSDRILIAAALEIAHELLVLRQSDGFDIEDFKRRIADIRKKINDVLIKN